MLDLLWYNLGQLENIKLNSSLKHYKIMEKYIYKFKEDTKFVFEIDKSWYAKEIKIWMNN